MKRFGTGRLQAAPRFWAAASRQTAAIRIVSLIAGLIAMSVSDAAAGMFSGFLQPAEPKHLTLTLFGAGYGSEFYDASHGGFEWSRASRADWD